MFRSNRLMVLLILLTISFLIAAFFSSSQTTIPEETASTRQVSGENLGTSGRPPALTIPHSGGGAFTDCSSCHARGARFKNVNLPHALDGTYRSCSSCHTLFYK